MEGKKRFWICLLLILAGIVAGSFGGMLASNVSFLSWLNYGMNFGISSPVTIDLGAIVLTFGLTLRVSIGSVIGIIIAIIVYKKVL